LPSSRRPTTAISTTPCLRCCLISFDLQGNPIPFRLLRHATHRIADHFRQSVSLRNIGRPTAFCTFGARSRRPFCFWRKTHAPQFRRTRTAQEKRRFPRSHLLRCSRVPHHRFQATACQAKKTIPMASLVSRPNPFSDRISQSPKTLLPGSSAFLLTQGQFDALVDFVFNLGSARLASSTLLRYLNAGKYDDAAWKLLAWDHAGSRELPALKLRRESEFRLWSPAAPKAEVA